VQHRLPRGRDVGVYATAGFGANGGGRGVCPLRLQQGAQSWAAGDEDVDGALGGGCKGDGGGCATAGC
jgi:hypothetical protein